MIKANKIVVLCSLLILLSLNSCSSTSYLLSTKNCDSKGQWAAFSKADITHAWDGAALPIDENNLAHSLKNRPHFSLRFKAKNTGFGSSIKKIELDEVLRELNLSCSQLESVHLSFRHTLGDVLLSSLPFIDQVSVELSGRVYSSSTLFKSSLVPSNLDQNSYSLSRKTF